MTMRVWTMTFVALLGIFEGMALAQQPASSAQVRRLETTWRDPDSVHAIIWTPECKPSPMPTLVFSPGFGQSVAGYSVLLSAWAKQGYFVVAIDHPFIPNPDSIEFHHASRLIARHLLNAINHIVRDR